MSLALLAKVLLKLRFVHPYGLLGGIYATAGEHEGDEIIKACRKGIDIPFGAAFRVAGEHSFAAAVNEAVHNRALKRNGARTVRAAEIIVFAGAAFQGKERKVGGKRRKFFVGGHGIASQTEIR